MIRLLALWCALSVLVALLWAAAFGGMDFFDDDDWPLL